MEYHSGDKGHVGVMQTCRRLKTAKVRIKYMREWVQRFIAECDFCQKQSYKRSRIETVPFTTAQTQQVMQRLAIDAIGPLEEDGYGYKYVLTVIDSFSRWVMAYPMKTQETNEVVRNLIKHIGIFGVPKEFQTDGGSTFTSAIMKEITDILKAKRKITVAYSHEENALVERWNHEIIRYLRGLVYDANSVEDWSDLLPFAQRICNAEVVESLGVAPAQIIFGAAINLDRAILVPNTEGLGHIATDHPPMSKYVEQLVDTQQKAIDYARRIQKEKDDEHMMTSGVDITEFRIGSLVTTSYPENQDGVSKPPSKLLTKRKGPFVVLSHTGSTYQIKHLADHKITNVHISRLEGFRVDTTRVDPVTIAAKDQREFIVAEILEHVPLYQPAKNKSTLEFLVRWKYYDDPEENTWVPWSDLTNNKICLRYCFGTPGMRSLVAARYRDTLFIDSDDDE
jgi:transposase InsO family protein